MPERVLLVYGTTEGHTAKIAKYMSEVLTERGDNVEVADVRELAHYDLRAYSAVLVGASMHVGKHDAKIRDFVAKTVADLNRLPSAFFSVSLTAASKKTWRACRC